MLSLRALRPYRIRDSIRKLAVRRWRHFPSGGSRRSRHSDLRIVSGHLPRRDLVILFMRARHFLQVTDLESSVAMCST